jgi:hypothetical protein
MDSSLPWRGSLNATRACALAEVFLAGAATAFNFIGGCMKARKIAESGRRLKEELKAADAAMFDGRCFRLRTGYGATGEV